MRIGFGYDVHKFSRKRKLILGGVIIPFDKGLAGHSDADVLLHSLCDAMLGAAGLKDIGYYFPNSDKKWKNISSLVLLAETNKLIRRKKFKVSNTDSTLLLEAPKIFPFTDSMKENISRILSLKKDAVSIKATTSEGLGFIGKGLGCASYSVCSLIRIKK